MYWYRPRSLSGVFPVHPPTELLNLALLATLIATLRSPDLSRRIGRRHTPRALCTRAARPTQTLLRARKTLIRKNRALESNDLFGRCFFRNQTKRAVNVALRDVRFSAFLVLESTGNGRVTHGSSVSNGTNGFRSFVSVALPRSNACRV